MNESGMFVERCEYFECPYCEMEDCKFYSCIFHNGFPEDESENMSYRDEEDECYDE